MHHAKTNLLAVIVACLGLHMAMAGEPFRWGINGHPVSQEGYWQVPLATQLDLVAELGAGWYRFDVSAEGFTANTKRLDELLSESEKRKLQLLPVIFSSPGARSKTASPAQIRTNAAAFAHAIVSRYQGRITHWELSNELDAYAMIQKGETMRNGKVWQWGDAEGSDPDTYHEARYQRAKAEIQGLHEGVKAADPSAQTIVNTAGWLHYGFIERLVHEDQVPFDILAWHWYSEMGDITNVQGKRNLVEFLQRYGKPLWITEINRRDGSKDGKEKEQADYVSQIAAQLRGNAGVKACFLYELLDEPYFGPSGESDYGLVELVKGSQGKWEVKRRKAAFEAFKSAIAKARLQQSPERP
jgi:hypothetical protein